MKRFTFILSLLLALTAATTADAQSFKALTTAVTSSSTAITALSEIPTEGGYYVLYNNGRSRFLKYNLLSGNMSVSATIDETSAEAGLYVFKITPVSGSSDKFTIETAVSGYYMPETTKSSNSTPVSTTADAAYQFTMEKLAEGLFGIKTTADIYFNGNPDDFVGWNGNGSNSQYKVIPVTPAETSCRVVTYNIKVGGTTNGTTKAIFKDGDVVNTSSVTTLPSSFAYSYYITPAIESIDEITVSETSSETSMNITTTKGTAPVTFNKVGSLRTRASTEGEKFGIKGNADGNVNAHNNINDASTYDDFLYHMWQLEETELGVKIKNIKTGTYLTNNGGNSATLSDNGTIFYFKQDTGTSNTFTLSADGTNTFGNHVGWSWSSWANEAVGTWDGDHYSDAGSIFTITYVDDTADLRTLAKTCLTNDYSNLETGGYVQTNYASYIEKTSVSTYDDITALASSITTQNLPPVDLDANKYYRIENVNGITKKYLSSESTTVSTEGVLTEEQTLNRTTSSDAFVPQLWKLTGSNGEYTLCNANNNAYLNAPSGTDAIKFTTGTAGTYTFTSRPDVTWNSGTNTPGYAFMLTQGESTHRINAFQGDANTVVSDWSGNHDADCGNFWRIKEVTAIPVTIGTTGYATINLPCAVTLPEGLKAFTGTKGESEVTLTEVTGTIPAKTPVLLQGTASTDYTLTIDYANTDAAPTDNAFSGTLAAASVGEGAYILKKGTNGIAFYPINKDSDTTVPANKAYLPSGTSPVIAFNFGNTTGINTIATDASESNTYYDLNGRRVFYPTKGIYVKGNGQKVFIK